MKQSTEEKYRLNESSSGVHQMKNKAEKAYNNTRKKAEKVFISNLYAALNKAETEDDFDEISTAADDYGRDVFLAGDWDNLSDAIHKKWRELGGNTNPVYKKNKKKTSGIQTGMGWIGA